jgi:hypothetical protein
LESYAYSDFHSDHGNEDHGARRQTSSAAVPVSTVAPENLPKPDATKHNKRSASNNEASTPDVPLVQVAGQPTGWAAMATDIRKYDEDKIKDCRDDIDTLMTFVSGGMSYASNPLVMLEPAGRIVLRCHHSVSGRILPDAHTK